MENKANRTAAIINIIVLVIDVILLIGLTAFSIYIGNSFLELYKGFNTTVPTVTKIVLYFGPYILIAGILILITKERLLKKKGVVLIINIVTLFIIFTLFIFYVVAVLLPVYRLGQMGQG